MKRWIVVPQSSAPAGETRRKNPSRHHNATAEDLVRGIERLGDRWLLLILNEALSGVTGFGDFRRRLNIADNVLTVRLERMVRAGLLRRVRDSGGNHPRYCYLPTSSASKARKVLEAFADWGQSK